MDSKRTVLMIAVISSLLTACASNVDDPTPPISRHSPKTIDKRAHNPKAAGYNVQLGIAYLQQGEIERAQHKLELAEKQDPKSALVLDAKAYYFESTSEPHEAEKFYRRAIKLNPDVGMAQNNYGAFLCRQRRFHEANQAFMVAVQDMNYASQGEAYENAGLCALQNHKIVEAEQYFTRALQKQPKLANSLLSLAKINYDKQDYGQAQLYLVRFNKFGKAEPESLKLAIQLADKQQDDRLIRSNLLALGKTFPDSQEYQALRVKYGQ